MADASAGGLGPPLVGLVLAGGRGARMGADKALLEYGGEPQVAQALRLLAGICGQALVSVRPDQAAQADFARFPQVVDGPGSGGPAAGLLAAWARSADVALLVLAVDLPLVEAADLSRLVAARRPERLATAFRHADGTPEPLCAIWEPAAREPIARGRHGGRSPSLRRLLEAGPAELVAAPDPARLRSVNTPEEYRAAAAAWRPAHPAG